MLQQLLVYKLFIYQGDATVIAEVLRAINKLHVKLTSSLNDFTGLKFTYKLSL